MLREAKIFLIFGGAFNLFVAFLVPVNKYKIKDQFKKAPENTNLQKANKLPFIL